MRHFISLSIWVFWRVIYWAATMFYSFQIYKSEVCKSYKRYKYYQTHHSFFFPASWCSLKNKESEFLSSYAGGPNSATCPLLSTRILSESKTVLMRWAIVSTVLSLNCSLITFCILLSVYRSIFAVASSISTILFLFSSDREMFMSCFSPELKLLPPYSITLSSPSLFSKLFQIPHRVRALMTCWSEKERVGSTLSLIVPVNRKCSCKMMLMLDRSYSRLRVLVSIPSM